MNKMMQDLRHVGSFSTINNSQKTMMNYGNPVYTERQNELYKRLLLGLNAYTKEEIYAMNSTKKNRIKNAHRKAQDFLNIWKQELMIETTNNIFNSLFPEANVTKELLSQTETSPEFKNTLTFKDLGIRKQDIVKQFLKLKLLPNNFASL